MALTKRIKTNEMKKTRRHDDDTGSPESQIAILTRRIDELSSHLKDNPKDKDSRKGLLGLIDKRRKQIAYLMENDPDAYESVAEELGLKSLKERQKTGDEEEEDEDTED